MATHDLLALRAVYETAAFTARLAERAYDAARAADPIAAALWLLVDTPAPQGADGDEWSLCLWASWRAHMRNRPALEALREAAFAARHVASTAFLAWWQGNEVAKGAA